ncbi:hypothetical protein AGMMS50255_1440 [Spirochaetia bacterium]|nr:hypothetical protein AGMMS50255_1440 [Spirochaetia bacterium]
MKSPLSAKPLFLLALLTLPLAYLAPQAAGRVDGNGNTLYYATLREAFEAAVGTSIDEPDEITLLTDITLAETILVDEPKHIRLISGGGNHTIMRDSAYISGPLLRVTGEAASLSLGKPGMEGELFIDGGYRSTPPIQAEAPLVVINGPDAKLIMYDKVTIQNNYNGGGDAGTNEYRNGAGVFIRTTGNNAEHQTEFIMKGGTIRGNINHTQNLLACGGGVYIAGFGIFTMEGGTIAGNTAYMSGGGFHTGSRGSFYKTGGIIYGKDAAAPKDSEAPGDRNSVIDGFGSPKYYGHALAVAQLNGDTRFRDDTVTENSRLSYTGHATANGVFGEGEKWSTPGNPFRDYIPLLILVSIVFLLFTALILILKKRPSKLIHKMSAEQIAALESLSPREREVFELLLKNYTLRQSGLELHISYNTVNFHYNNIYRKLGVSSRGELLLKYTTRISGHKNP